LKAVKYNRLTVTNQGNILPSQSAVITIAIRGDLLWFAMVRSRWVAMVCPRWWLNQRPRWFNCCRGDKRITAFLRWTVRDEKKRGATRTLHNPRELYCIVLLLVVRLHVLLLLEVREWSYM